MAIEAHEDLLEFYRHHTEVSDPRSHAVAYAALPDDVPALCALLHGVMVHMWWIGKDTYGFTREDLAAAERDIVAEISLRTTEDMLARIFEFDARPLTHRREPTGRLVGNCRDYALLLTSFLRHRGTPARVRTGVARYFDPNRVKLEDHWICEFWNEDEGRWQQADPQIDQVMRKTMRLSFDPIDIPAGRFHTGWQCYDLLRRGAVAPQEIGFPPDYCGMGYVLNKMLADLCAVTGEELVPWAGWGLGGPDGGTLPGDGELAAQIADILRNIDQPDVWLEARDLVESHPRLARPANYDAGPFQIEWLG